MNKNILLLAAAGIGLYFLMNKKEDTATAAGYDTSLLSAWIERIKSQPDWYAAEIDKAAANGRSIDEQLLIDAKYAIDLNWTL